MFFSPLMAMFLDISFSITGILIVISFVCERVDGSFPPGATTPLMENKSSLWNGIESVYSFTDVLFSKGETTTEENSPYPELLDSPRFLVSKILTKLFFRIYTIIHLIKYLQK